MSAQGYRRAKTRWRMPKLSFDGNTLQRTRAQASKWRVGIAVISLLCYSVLHSAPILCSGLAMIALTAGVSQAGFYDWLVGPLRAYVGLR